MTKKMDFNHGFFLQNVYVTNVLLKIKEDKVGMIPIRV
jgi:hypothetical protein